MNGGEPKLTVGGHVKRSLIIIIFSALISWGAWCHPHVFMDTRIEVAYNERGVAGFWITWDFDKVFTASILMDFDHDHDKQLNPGEVADIEANAFSNLANYNYFLYMRCCGNAYRPTAVKDFSAYMQDERIHYRFFVPYALPLGDGAAEVNLACYDDTFFCAISYAEPTAVRFPSSESFNGSYEICEDRGIHIDYIANDGSSGSTFPLQVVLTLRRRS
jgi:ABC-type uncharacterized transport system substrate-binding protein